MSLLLLRWARQQQQGHGGPQPPCTGPWRPTWSPRPVWLATRSTTRSITSPRWPWRPRPPATSPTTSSTTPLSSEPTAVWLSPTDWLPEPSTPPSLLLPLPWPLLWLLKSSSPRRTRTTKEILSSCRNMKNTDHEFASCYLSSHSIVSI